MLSAAKVSLQIKEMDFFPWYCDYLKSIHIIEIAWYMLPLSFSCAHTASEGPAVISIITFSI